MISNQIALKPFMGRLAQREGQSYDQMVQTQGQGMASIPEDQFLNDPQVKGSEDFAKGLRLKASDIAEMQADFGKQGVNTKLTTALVNMMAVTAMALEPSTAAGLDGAMRLLLMGEKPLENSAVQNGEIAIKPSMERIAKELDTDVSGMLKQVAAEYKSASPEDVAKGQARMDATIKTASVFNVAPGEVAELQDTLKKEGLDDKQSEALISGLVVNAVAYEPTFRAGLDQIFGLQYRQEKPMTESAFEAR